MNRSLRWAARTARALAGHVNRLRATLDVLAARLREAVARAVGQSVAGAALDAVHALLAEADTGPVPAAATSYARRSPHLWQDPEHRAAPSWRDDPDDMYRPPPDEDDEEVWREEAPEAPPASAGRRWGLALAVGCQAAAWQLRRQTGRFTPLAALGVGVAAAAAAFLTGPLLLAGAGLAGSALTLAALADAARCAAAALFGVGGP